MLQVSPHAKAQNVILAYQEGTSNPFSTSCYFVGFCSIQFFLMLDKLQKPKDTTENNSRLVPNDLAIHFFALYYSIR